MGSRSNVADLDRQLDICREYVRGRWGEACTIEENTRVVSGLNFNEKNIISFTIKLINKAYTHVIITYKDRLARSSFDLWSNLAEYAGTEIICLEEQEDPSYEQELLSDCIALMTIAACRHNGKKYGQRSSIEIAETDLVLLYEKYKSGMNYADLVRFCREKGIVDTKKAGRPLSKDAIRKAILKYDKMVKAIKRVETNSFEEFLRSHLIQKEGGILPRPVLVEAYKKWAEKYSKQICSITAIKDGCANFGLRRVQKKVKEYNVYVGYALREV